MINPTTFANVTSFTDRHGKLRWRFRKVGFRTHFFKAEPGSPEFTEEYCWAMEQVASAPSDRPQRRQDRHWHDVRHLAGLELVYFIGGRQGPIKIGRTKNVAARLKKLQTGYHRRLYLLAAIPGSQTLEEDLHKRFAPQRMMGEWFARSAELAAMIRKNRPSVWRTDLANLEPMPEKR